VNERNKWEMKEEEWRRKNQITRINEKGVKDMNTEKTKRK
jgi:hypothetical protein